MPGLLVLLKFCAFRSIRCIRKHNIITNAIHFISYTHYKFIFITILLPHPWVSTKPSKNKPKILLPISVTSTIFSNNPTGISSPFSIAANHPKNTWDYYCPSGTKKQTETQSKGILTHRYPKGVELFWCLVKFHLKISSPRGGKSSKKVIKILRKI